jgi:hypothetical protein
LVFDLSYNYLRSHNAKAHAIAYMPMVIAGFILVYQKNVFLGGLITLFMLEINANHFQMTYYLLILLLILVILFLLNLKQRV